MTSFPTVLRRLKHPFLRGLVLLLMWLLIYKLYCRIYRKIKRLPNGCDGLPLIGCLIHAMIHKHKFGTWEANNFDTNITFNWIGIFNKIAVANIHSAKVAKELFGHPNCQDRDPHLCAMVANEPDVLRVKYGNEWKKRRKLIRSVLLTIENSDYVDHNVHNLIFKYTDPIIVDANNKDGGGIIECKQLSKSIRHLTFSMIFKTMFGQELSPNSEAFSKLDTLYEDWTTTASVSFSMQIIFGSTMTTKWLEKTQEMENELDALVESYCKPSIDKFDENNKITYFDHSYSFICNDSNGNITLKQLIMDFRILIQASIDTASFVIDMALLNLVKYKDIQEIVFNELKKEFKTENKIELKRVHKCPQFRAYVNEILRIALPVPTGVPRYATDDIVIMNGKYVIPKGTICALDLQYIHYYDQRKWGVNGMDIDLDHWLVSDGKNGGNKKFKNRNDVFPFSVGFRDCVGRSLALRLLYCIIGNMILNYKFDNKNKEFKIQTEFVGTSSQRVAMNETSIVINKR